MSAKDDKQLALALYAGAVGALVLAEQQADKAPLRLVALTLGAYASWQMFKGEVKGNVEDVASAIGSFFGPSLPPPPTSVSIPSVPVPKPAPNEVLWANGPAVVGSIITPAQDSNVPSSVLSGGYTCTLELENVGTTRLSGLVLVSLHEMGVPLGSQSFQVTGPDVTLSPGERRRVTMQLQSRLRWCPVVNVSAQVRWAGHHVTSGFWSLD